MRALSTVRAKTALLAALVVAGLAAPARSTANTYTVTNTLDSGAGSLRQAIMDANANTGADTIAFNIPVAGVQTITPATALPKITGAVTINGYSQPGASPNTNPPDQGLNTVLLVEINCTNTAGGYCLVIGADNVTIRGLAMHHGTYTIATDFTKNIQNAVIEGCFLGTTADGLTSVTANGNIILGNHTNARIGGTTPAARNLLAAGHSQQIQVSFAPNNGSVIEGSLFCTDKTGAVSMGTSSSAIGLSGGGGAGNTSNMTIGGLTAAAANTFACNATNLSLTDMSDVRVQGNHFGTDVSGSFGFSLSTGIGVYLTGGDSTIVIGGTAPGAGNVIGGLLRGIA